MLPLTLGVCPPSSYGQVPRPYAVMPLISLQLLIAIVPAQLGSGAPGARKMNVQYRAILFGNERKICDVKVVVRRQKKGSGGLFVAATPTTEKGSKDCCTKNASRKRPACRFPGPAPGLI
jgi:hypothetical protein